MIFINYRKLAQIFVVLSFWSCVAHAESRSLIYKAIVVDEIANNSLQKSYIDTIEIDEKNGHIKYNNGRVLIELVNCGDKNWKCISDGSLEFAIPKNGKVSAKSWSYRNISYSVIQTEGEARTHNTYFILAEPKSSTDRNIPSKIFLYSESKGILGITMLQGQSLIPVTYLREDLK